MKLGGDIERVEVLLGFGMKFGMFSGKVMRAVSRKDR